MQLGQLWKVVFRVSALAITPRSQRGEVLLHHRLVNRWMLTGRDRPSGLHPLVMDDLAVGSHLPGFPSALKDLKVRLAHQMIVEGKRGKSEQQSQPQERSAQ